MSYPPFRIAAGLLQRLRRFVWRFSGRPSGVHGLPLTPSRNVVLVKLTYARGWRLPGGGVRRRETPADAVLRELAEEIGMIGHGSFEEVTEYRASDAGAGSLFIVRDVSYVPKRSLEIAAIKEFDPTALPPDISPRWRKWIERLGE